MTEPARKPRPSVKAARGSGFAEQSPASGPFAPRSVLAAEGAVDLAGVEAAFGMTRSQIAETAGLPRETLQKSDRRNAPRAAGRLREMLEILHRVQAWAGGPAQAMAWYRAEPIPPARDRADRAPPHSPRSPSSAWGRSRSCPGPGSARRPTS